MLVMATYEQFAGRGVARTPREIMRRLWRTLRMAIGRHRQRRALATMERWQLDDLGLSREDADREAGRRPWEGVAQE